MKILVDKLPKTPKECWFAKRNVERGYICSLQHCSCSIEYGLMECPCLKATDKEGAGSGEQCGSV